MRILNLNGEQMQSYDESKGYVEQEEINSEYHEAQEQVQQQSHYEVIKEYPQTGGKDVQEVIDVPYQPAREAYYDKETILRYHPYTDEQLTQIAEEKAEVEKQEQIKEDHENKLDSLYNSKMTFADVVDILASMLYGGDTEL